MARIVQITVSPNHTERLLEEIRRLQGLVGLRVQRGISIEPPGDVVTVETINRSLHTLMQLLDRYGVGHHPGGSITTSEPKSVISSSSVEAITNDTSEATWEEMETVLGKESNMTLNGLVLMGVSGVLAAVGIATGALHLVIAAMIIAPGFEPITRFALGVVTQTASWKRGLSHTGYGYGTLMLGAVAATLVLLAMGSSPLDGRGSYLSEQALVVYWTSPNLASLSASTVASIAGAVLIASNRAVLTAGVMVALALVPTAAIAGMALISGEWALCGWAALRWGIDVVLVTTFSLLVFLLKRVRTHQRKMLL